MKNLIVKAILIAAVVGLVGCTNTNNQTVGTATGAVAGGLIGSAIGAGTGQIVAIGVGAVAGALIGGAIGKNMDDNDRAQASGAVSHGRTTYWVNKRTGVRYKVVMDQWVTIQGNPNCRRFHTIAVTPNGHKYRSRGVACRVANGNWYTMR